MSKKGLLIVNLGTPDEPTWNGLRKYLNQFLTDRRVIDLWAPLRHGLFKGIVVPIRSRRVSKDYAHLWLPEGSPLKVYGERVVAGVQDLLHQDFEVELGMRYQNPSIEAAIDRLLDKHVSEIVVFPLFPQYASATTGSVFEEIMRVLKSKEQIPSLRLINSYYDHPGMIELYASNAQKYNLKDYDHFIFSFHGVPKRYLEKENDFCNQSENCCTQICDKNQFCYTAQCHATANKIAEQIGVTLDQYTLAYQSKFGPEEWARPYLDDVIDHQLEKGNKKLLVFSPAFVADCLETTLEIGEEYKETFLEKGGEKWDLIESLNADPKWIQTIANIVSE